jgi:hypothetical protein
MSHIEVIKQLQERIAELEVRVQVIEGERPCEVKPVTLEQYLNCQFNSEEAFLREAQFKHFIEVLDIR